MFRCVSQFLHPSRSLFLWMFCIVASFVRNLFLDALFMIFIFQMLFLLGEPSPIRTLLEDPYGFRTFTFFETILWWHSFLKSMETTNVFRNHFIHFNYVVAINVRIDLFIELWWKLHIWTAESRVELLSSQDVNVLYHCITACNRLSNWWVTGEEEGRGTCVATSMECRSARSVWNRHSDSSLHSQICSGLNKICIPYELMKSKVTYAKKGQHEPPRFGGGGGG